MVMHQPKYGNWEEPAQKRQPLQGASSHMRDHTHQGVRGYAEAGVGVPEGVKYYYEGGQLKQMAAPQQKRDGHQVKGLLYGSDSARGSGSGGGVPGSGRIRQPGR